MFNQNIVRTMNKLEAVETFQWRLPVAIFGFTRSCTFEFVGKKAICKFLSSLRARFITNTGIVGSVLLMEERRSSILNSSMWRHAPEYRGDIVSLSCVYSLRVLSLKKQTGPRRVCTSKLDVFPS